MRRPLVAAVLSLVILAGCGSAAWPKTAAETTCTEWSDQMTSAQRDSLGTAMLQIVERLQRLGHDVVARNVVQARDHGHAARIVLVARVVETVGLWRHALVQL